MSLKFRVAKTTIAFVSAMSISHMSTAQISSEAEADELTAIYACRAETDSMKRLACFDAAVGRFEEAQAQGEIVTVTKKQIEEVEKDSFGFNLPSIPKLSGLFGGKKDNDKVKNNPLTDPIEVTKSAERPETPQRIEQKPITNPEIKEIEATIVKTQKFGYNRIRFFLANGQVWEQAESRDVRVPKIRDNNKPTAKIRKASLGSFLMRINDRGSAIRVRRVR